MIWWVFGGDRKTNRNRKINKKVSVYVSNAYGSAQINKSRWAAAGATTENFWKCGGQRIGLAEVGGSSAVGDYVAVIFIMSDRTGKVA